MNGELGIWDVEFEGLNEGSVDGRVNTDDGVDGYKDKRKDIFDEIRDIVDSIVFKKEDISEEDEDLVDGSVDGKEDFCADDEDLVDC